MKRPKNNGLVFHPGISMHHIPVEGAIGLLFVLATIFIFGVGIPAVRGLLVITGTLGILGSGLLLCWHKRRGLKIRSLDLHNSKSGTSNSGT